MHLKTFVAVAGLLTAAATQAQSSDLKLSADNIPEIVKELTLQEKARLLVGRNDYTFGGYDNPDEFVRFIAPSVSGYTQGVPRLGIPPTALVDGPAGVVVVDRPDVEKHYVATGFPVGIALASTWDTDLVQSVGTAMGNEVLEYGLDVILAPGMNIHRSPLCGRNYEYYSEDPFVTGKIAAAFVRGIQSNGVGTSLKHYAVNSQETNRTEVDEIVDQRTLREIYLKGFEIAVKEAQPWTVMASYNRLNGPYTQENYDLLTTVLRDEWGFDGIVMTDWIQQRHTDQQIKSGVDNLQPGYQVQIEDIDAMVADGRLTMAEIDTAVTRMLRYIVKTPHFRNYKYSDNPDLEAHAAVTRKSATEGMVLLKNEGNALPLKDVKRAALFGIHSYDFLAGGTGSGHVVKPYVVDMRQGLANAGIEIDKDMNDMYTAYMNYGHARNRCDRDPDERWYVAPPLPELPVSKNCIRTQARNADVAIVTIGRQAGEGSDRSLSTGFNLTATEQDLLRDICDEFHAQGKKVIVVLNVGGAIETASWKGLPDAILLAWQPGQEGGNSVADVLLGKENPSGKLTLTFPIAAMDVPSSLNFPTEGNQSNQRQRQGQRRNIDYTLHSEGLDVGYRYFSTRGREVSYPFGYGKSYTTFAYSKPVVKADKDGFTASITVTNTGSVAGKEIVQLYVTAPDGKLYKPAIELKSFAKTRELQPGESQTLTMHVTAYDLASYDTDIQSWVTDKGTYRVNFAAAADDVRGTGTYRQPRTLTWPAHDVLAPTREL